MSFKKTKQYVSASTLLIVAVLIASLLHPGSVHADATITVNTTADNTTAGDGFCTLREAINNANSGSDTTGGDCTAGSAVNVIDFNITGTPDFTNNGQNGYTIEPTSALPDITSQVIIDGYSQPGSAANTAVAPDPLNGTLLVQLDGENAGVANALDFGTGGDNGAVKGLVINNFSNSGINMNASGVIVQGDYIGTDPSGMIARHNEVGVDGTAGTPGINAMIGGLLPSDRNLISGNNNGSSATAGYPASGWTVQGNYIGVAADGVTPLGNSRTGGPGGMSIDGTTGVLIGGTQTGAVNVISGNHNAGLAPDGNSTGTIIEGNLIGTDYTGTVAVPNAGPGITTSTVTGFTIGGTTSAARNIISGNGGGGVFIGDSASGTIEGNYIGLDKTGTLAVPNTGPSPLLGVGVLLAGYGGVTIGGTTSGARNVISGQGRANIFYLPGTNENSVVEGNYIGTNASGAIDPAITAIQGMGIELTGAADNNIIGGTSAGAGNLIAGNRGFGVGVETFTATSVPVTVTPTDNAILGNEIYGNVVNSSLPDTPAGLGIDLFHATDTSNPYDFVAEYFTDLGQNVNANAGDVPGQANDYINHPAINSVVYSGSTVNANFSLNVAGGTTGQYRVEFFASDNNTAGQGQTYLGSTNVAPGNNLIAALTAPNGFSLAGKYITATVTELNVPSVNSGFGSTSEFSDAVLASYTTKTLLAASPIAPDTGYGSPTQSQTAIYALIASSIVLISLAVIYRRIAFKNK